MVKGLIAENETVSFWSANLGSSVKVSSDLAQDILNILAPGFDELSKLFGEVDDDLPRRGWVICVVVAV